MVIRLARESRRPSGVVRYMLLRGTADDGSPHSFAAGEIVVPLYALGYPLNAVMTEKGASSTGPELGWSSVRKPSQTQSASTQAHPPEGSGAKQTSTVAA